MVYYIVQYSALQTMAASKRSINTFLVSSILVPLLILFLIIYGCVKQVDLFILMPLLVYLLLSFSFCIGTCLFYRHTRYEFIYGINMLQWLLDLGSVNYFFRNVVGESFADYGLLAFVVPTLFGLTPLPSFVNLVDEEDFR